MDFITKQTCSRPGSDLEHIWVRSEPDLSESAPDLTHVSSRSESGLEQIYFVTKSIHAPVLIQT